MEDDLYTTQQVASFLGVSDVRVRQMIAKGQAIPKTRIGNSYVFTKAEIERLRTRPKGKGGRGKKAQ